MPVEFAAYVVQKTTWAERLSGPNSLITLLLFLLTVALYRYSQGTRNPHVAKMHGKVCLVTGGTSGIGAATARALAAEGAQIILLVRSVDGWVEEYVASLRSSTGNDLIYAEACDLADLSSVRAFATRWIDNTPVRRLDQVILCAGVTQPPLQPRRTTRDGVEVQFGVNYLAPFLLLSILSPALRAQPSERDVRVIVTTCTSYILAAVDLEDLEFSRRGYPSSTPWHAFGASKLFGMSLARELQRRIDAFERPDKLPSRVKCLTVDPGLARTSSFRRFLSFGTLFGLMAYLLTYPLSFLFIKSAESAAEGILFASMAPSADIHESGVRGGELYQECRVKEVRRAEVKDVAFGERLWQVSERYVKEVETRSALARKAAARQEAEAGEGRA